MENNKEELEKKAERVIIFIDGSNFYHSIKETFDLHDNQIDFRKEFIDSKILENYW